jgi:hypothetical protein
MQAIEVGDTLTISGVRRSVRNPARRWWQLWRPRWVKSADLANLRVVSSAKNLRVYDDRDVLAFLREDQPDV